MPLREAIARFYRERHSLDLPASRIIVTAGSSAALLLAFGVLLDPGDEVLLADPSYPCNRHFMRTLGAVPKAIAGRAGAALPAHGGAGARALGCGHAHGDGREPFQSHRHAGFRRGDSRTSRRSRARRAARCWWMRSTTGLTYGIDPPTAVEEGDDIVVVNSFSKYFQMTGLAPGLARGAAAARAPYRDARAEPLHLAFDRGAARGARMLHATDARDRRGASP